MTATDAKEIFAKLMLSLAPYAEDIVLIGGWVHALYLADANRATSNKTSWPLQTDDIDFTIPPVLLTADRPTLVELAQAAGFTFDRSSYDFAGELPSLVHPLGGAVVDLDFLTKAAKPDDAILIEGQSGLVAHGYPDLDILSTYTQWITIGDEIHPLLHDGVKVRVPIPAAYVLQKGLASNRRINPSKSAKDLVYLYEIIRHPGLGEQVREMLPAIGRERPQQFEKWGSCLSSMRAGAPPLTDVVEQLRESNRAQGSPEDVGAQVLSRIRRLIGETQAAISKL